MLPAPAIERSLAATARPAETQERLCQATLLIHVARSESLLRGPQLAVVPTWRGATTVAKDRLLHLLKSTAMTARSCATMTHGSR